jgi:hypothetical protein
MLHILKLVADFALNDAVATECTVLESIHRWEHEGGWTVGKYCIYKDNNVAILGSHLHIRFQSLIWSSQQVCRVSNSVFLNANAKRFHYLYLLHLRPKKVRKILKSQRPLSMLARQIDKCEILD